MTDRSPGAATPATGALIGDPTEGALIVLAEKGGIGVDGARQMYPRVAEVPFDSDYKFMATFHNMQNEQGKPVVRCFVKGAPDVLIARSGSLWTPGGDVLPVTEENGRLALEENERMAQGRRTCHGGGPARLRSATFDPKAKLLDVMNDLTLLAMVGIVDPPRAEAKDAIAKCHSAGIQVRMITGDHAVTAAAIGHELGIEGKALTGAQFAALSDDELKKQLPEIGVVARVAPEDKIRLVRLLQQQSNIVAMTGDGVNDAPALKKADIGVAMGITGTEVSKGAAVMILTDDNFATIVKAVEFGRGIYDNLAKYVRFQMTALVASSSATWARRCSASSAASRSRRSSSCGSTSWCRCRSRPRWASIAGARADGAQAAAVEPAGALSWAVDAHHLHRTPRSDRHPDP